MENIYENFLEQYHVSQLFTEENKKNNNKILKNEIINISISVSNE